MLGADSTIMLSGGNEPLHQCLRLYNAHLAVRPTGPCTGTLRKLAITLSPSTLYLWPSLSQILGVFSMLPCLEELRFGRQDDELAFGALDALEQRVTLPRVQTLALAVWACECTLILDALELPSLSLQQVSARERCVEDIHELAPVLRTKMSCLGTARRFGIAGFRDDHGCGPLCVYGFTGAPLFPTSTRCVCAGWISPPTYVGGGAVAATRRAAGNDD